MAAGGSVKVILGSLAANAGIAVAKGVAAFFTGSGAMLAESIHSAADCTNQIMLLIGAKEASAAPTAEHPLGRGRAAYFWSFMVALMIFFGGGVFAIREGIHKWAHPEPVKDAWVGYIVLIVAIFIEGLALFQVTRALMKKKGDETLFRYLGKSKDVDLVVLFAEDTAAVLGLVVAMASLFLAQTTGDGRFDAFGSIAIGTLLCLVAVWLAREVKSLIQGESASPEIEAVLREEAASSDAVIEVIRTLSVQQGPGQVMLAAKLRMSPALTGRDIAVEINKLEARVCERCPEVQWQFIEPDITD